MNYQQLVSLRAQLLETINMVDEALRQRNTERDIQAHVIALVQALPRRPYRARELWDQMLPLSWRTDVVPVLRQLGWVSRRNEAGMVWFPPSWFA